MVALSPIGSPVVFTQTTVITRLPGGAAASEALDVYAEADTRGVLPAVDAGKHASVAADRNDPANLRPLGAQASSVDTPLLPYMTDSKAPRTVLELSTRKVQIFEDLLAIDSDRLLALSPQSVAQAWCKNLADEDKAQIRNTVANLQDQARLARQIKKELAAATSDEERARITARLLDRMARHMWDHKLKVRNWLQAVLPEALWIPYGFVIEEPEKASIQIGTPGHPYHIVLTLGDMDFKRFYGQHPWPSRYLSRAQKAELKKIWAGGCNFVFNHGQMSVIKKNLKMDPRVVIAHEEAHALDRLAGSLEVFSQMPKSADAKKMRAWRQAVQVASMHTELIAYTGQSRDINVTEIMQSLLNPQRYSGHIWYDAKDIPTKDLDAHLGWHHYTTIQSLQMAQIIMQHPSGAHLLRFTALRDWPQLARELVEQGLICDTEGLALLIDEKNEVAILTRVQELILKTRAFMGNGEKEPPLYAFTGEDLALIAWVEARALNKESLYRDEEALIQQVQLWRQAWLESMHDVPNYGKNIKEIHGSDNPDKALAEGLGHAHRIFFPEQSK